MFGLMLKSTHEASVERFRISLAYRDQRIIDLTAERDAEREKARVSGRLAAETLAELAPLKAAKERQLQNLRDANARRAQSAFERALTETN